MTLGNLRISPLKKDIMDSQAETEESRRTRPHWIHIQLAKVGTHLRQKVLGILASRLKARFERKERALRKRS